MGFYRGPTIVRDGLVLYLDAANPKSYPGSGVDWKDLSGRNNGTLMNGPTFNSDKKGSILLDGVNDHIKFNNPISTLSGNTFDFWVKRIQSINQFNMIFGGTGSFPYMALRSNNRFHLSWRDSLDGSNPQRSLYSTNSFSDNKWYNFTCTLITNIEAGTTKAILYINGLEESRTTTDVDSFYVSAITPIIGDYNYYLNYPFYGGVSSARIYDRVLNEDEVLQNYNATKTRFK